MGRHNGKSRQKNKGVGKALASRGLDGTDHGRRVAADLALRHAADDFEAPNKQSVLDMSDLEEFMALAQLQDRDWTAERGQVVVIHDGAESQARVTAEERRAAEEANRHLLRIPRRPKWDQSTSAEELADLERVEFLEWRREIAKLEEDPRLTVSPFEKNPEVWRQLWRVVERSDIVVQVLDARDPLFYRCLDLEVYTESHRPPKRSLLLLNKADLLSAHSRKLWADYFDRVDVKYIFWSAHAANEELDGGEAGGEAAAAARGPAGDPRLHVHTRGELLERLEGETLAALATAGVADPRGAEGEQRRRLAVGLVGYPNVGKSSTINALLGEKKTVVSATPGKTKHFQTLIMENDLLVCDCPGLVFPQFAETRAKMVANGVIPINTLTEIRAPVDAVVRLFPPHALEAFYKMRLPPKRVGEDPDRPPTAEEVLRCISLVRGYVVQGGRADEAKAGRLLLRDFTEGKLRYNAFPPGAGPGGTVGVASVAAAAARTGEGAERAAPAPAPEEGPSTAWSVSAAHKAGGASSQPVTTAYQQDMDLLQDLAAEDRRKAARRPDYKFKKKQARSKGNRGRQVAIDADGSALATGKKGGLRRDHYNNTG